MSVQDADEALLQFLTVLDDAFGLFLQPYRLFRRALANRTLPRKVYPPWVSPELRAAIKRKYDLFSRSKKYPTAGNHTAYKQQRNVVRSLSRSCHREYIKSVEHILTTDKPNLHKFVRMQRRWNNDSTIPDLHDRDGLSVSGNLEKATLLNQQFASVAVPDDPSIDLPHMVPSSAIGTPLSSLCITTATVRKAISRLKCGRSPGLDGVTNELMKKLAPSIAYPLCKLFNLSFSSGCFPSAWKLAKIVPIFKNKGSKSQACNYRPISLLSCISKLCERLVFDTVYSHVSPALTSVQSGFRQGDSTTLQLTRLIQDIEGLRHQKQQVGICFFDLEKAFDTVWHRALLAKLSIVFRIEGSILAWLSDYLRDRRQMVCVSGTFSDSLPVASGVPQGSILGPLLFILFVNDLPLAVSGVSLFADDTALLRSDTNPVSLSADLQRGINSVHEWMMSWRLRPNIHKTEVMFIPPLEQLPALTMPGASSPIDIVSSHKHLGVVLDSQLCWKDHTQLICKKASKTLGCLVSHCSHLSPDCIRLFYNSYILPLFLYASTAWSSGLSATVQASLEIHHKKVLKILFRKPTRYPTLDLYSLAKTSPLSTFHRRLLCVLVHSIFLGAAPSHLQRYDWFQPEGRTRNCVALPPAKSIRFTHSPLFAAYSLWLLLSNAIKFESPTMHSFKRSIKDSIQ